MSIGVQFPFSLATGSLGYFEVTQDVLAAIAANVKALLSTNWGERPMHYELGANLIEFIFEPRTPTLRGRIGERITSQIKRWMPFLVPSELYVLFTEDDSDLAENSIRIKMKILFGNRVVIVDHTVTP